LLFLAAFYSHYCYQWVGFTVLLNSVYALQLQSAITSVLDVLNGFAADPLFAEQFELVFGKSISSSAFQAALASLPQFEVRSDQDLAGALGAFSAQTGKIYLTESLVNGDPGQLNAVLLEEIGHYLDFYFNGAIDSAGDEGDIFSRLVRGNSIDAVTLQALKAENDWATVTIDGQQVAIEQALTPGSLVSASTYLFNQDVKDNFFYENVQTVPSAIGGPPAFRARFKNILLPSTLWNTPYAPIPTSALNGTIPPNTTLIDPLDSTEKGLLIHTSTSGTGSIYSNIWEPTDNANLLLANLFATNLGNATNTLTKELLAEDTFNGTTVNLGYLSRSQGSYIKATLVWTGVPGGGLSTDANLNLTLQGTTSLSIYTPSFLALNTPTSFIVPTGLALGFNGTDTVPGGTINAVDYIEQIFIPSGDLDPSDSSYNVTIGGTLGTVSPTTGQDFSIFFSVVGVVGNGHGHGDVHLSTFDGKPYEFQTTGDFILVKSLIDDFQVQTRQESSPYWVGYSVNTAFAINLGGYNINYYIDLAQAQRLSIDGQSYDLLSGETLDLGIAQITRQGNQYTFTYAGPDGIISTNDDDLVTAFVYEDTINTSQYYIDVDVNPADYRSGSLQGLLGNGDGITSNDFALRDGTDLQLNPGQWTQDPTVHTTFADSWRVTQTESLFTTTAASTSFAKLASKPSFSLDNFDTQAVANAFALVNAAGVAAGEFQVAAVIDYLVTGDPSFINSAKQFSDFVLQNDDGVIQLGSIKGSKWNDANGNGIWDTGEQTLAGWTIYIDSFANGQLDPWELSTVTDANGQYSFTNLGTGEYYIREVLQTGWVQTASPSSVILGAGETRTDVNFGNNKPLPVISVAVSPVSVAEDGPTNLVYTFTRTGSLATALTVKYSIGGTAIANDYTGATPGTGKLITFAIGSATAILTIDPTADITFEPHETVVISLTADTGYAIGTTTAVTGTITNDDLPSINLSPNGQTVVEGLTSPQNLSYTVSLSGSSTQTITVQYSTANGTALAGSDYTATSGTLTFTPSVTSQTISIPILNDSVNEANETFTLKLTSPTNAILGGTATVTTTITDTLSASTTTTLPANVENLTLTGSSVINGTGNAGNNILTGNTANNTLNGGAGNDTLNGGAGNDTLIGGAGKDTLTGGTGTDKFVFTSLADSLLAGYDVISDYTIGEQIDAPSSIVSPTTLNASIGNIGSLSAANRAC
jgi:hypothetical protein